jgi:vitamin B12/bleomycin/antimicrobial peptide transport system ATP-binding/permease protein
VRISEHADGIVLHGGEADERRLLDQPVNGVVTMMTRLAGALARLTWITSGYGWLAMVVPIVVAAPGYFDGDLSFGTLMMVVGAFNQVQSSLRWFVDNLPQIADWRATLLRVVAFRNALATVDTIGRGDGSHRGHRLGVRQARVRRFAARAARTLRDAGPAPGRDQPRRTHPDPWRGRLGQNHAVPGARGHVALGRGDASVAAREEMTFMPQRPYMPFGTLRAAVCYPAEPGRFDEAAVVAALERVDLGDLVPSLDHTERWDRQLPLDEQQRLAFARLLLHAPRWVVADDALSALSDSHRRRVLSFCDRELIGVTLIRLGRDSVLDGFWSRTLHTLERPGGPKLRADLPSATGGAGALPTGAS